MALDAERVLIAHKGSDATVHEVDDSNPVPVKIMTGIAGSASLIVPAVVVSTPVYTIGDSVAGKITLTNAMRVTGGTGRLASVEILDRANVKPAITLIFLDSDPVTMNPTDNVALVVGADDSKILGVLPIITADYKTINAKAIATIRNIGLTVRSTTQNIYVAILADAAITFVSTSDLQLKFGFIQD